LTRRNSQRCPVAVIHLAALELALFLVGGRAPKLDAHQHGDFAEIVRRDLEDIVGKHEINELGSILVSLHLEDGRIVVGLFLGDLVPVRVSIVAGKRGCRLDAIEGSGRQNCITRRLVDHVIKRGFARKCGSKTAAFRLLTKDAERARCAANPLDQPFHAGLPRQGHDGHGHLLLILRRLEGTTQCSRVNVVRQ
jgi:hypothetical protein